jgi:hypothetical protein
MEPLSNAVLSELVNRSVSFLLAKFEKQTTASTAEDDLLRRLRQLLLRSATVVEEAEQRHVTNRAMLQQLKALRDETFRGHYVLDAVTCRAPRGGGDGSEDDEEEELGRRAFSLSRFNTAKRVRFPASGGDRPEPSARAFAGSSRELPSMVRSLEAMLDDMKEFVVFLTSYPPLHRQPYSAHLSVGKCMFGLQMERETVMEFLLHPTPPGAGNPGVLPILGPPHIGKSTLVENVCADEKVRNHFSLILFYNGNELKDETMASLRDNCVIKHRRNVGEASGERLLIVIELLDDYDVDDETWDKLTGSFSQTSVPQGTKIIITSRCENVARLGTTKALELRCLTAEAYWYLFKMMVFGSDDPGQHPEDGVHGVGDGAPDAWVVLVRASWRGTATGQLQHPKLGPVPVKAEAVHAEEWQLQWRVAERFQGSQGTTSLHV